MFIPLNNKSTKKNIAVITPGFAITEADDFTIPALQELIKGIKKYKPQWSITIFTLHFPYTSTPYDYFGFKVIPFNGGNKKWKKLFIREKLKRQFEKEHSHSPFDLIHSFWFSESTYLGQFLSRKYKLPHICSCYGQDVLADNPYLSKINTEELALVYSTLFQKEKSVIKTEKESYLIPCGMDHLPSNNEEKTIDIIAAGNLTPLKNHSLFIDVIHKLVSDYPHLKTLILGEGILLDKLNRKITDLGLTENVKLMGKQSRKKTLELMHKSKVLLHTSHYESFGLIFLEAQQCQCHIVSTPVGVALEMSFAKIGDDASSLSAAVESSFKQPLPSFKNNYPILSVIEQYEHLYNM